MNKYVVPIKYSDYYRIAFNTIDEGFNVIEKVTTGQNERIDFRYILTNPAFERITGLTDVIGKTVMEVLPGVNDSTMQVYDNVIKTGQPVRFEAYEAALGRWFSAYVFSLDDPKLERVAVIFKDISDLKISEKMLRESTEHETLLLKLSDVLHPLSDPAEIHGAVTRTAMDYFKADRCYYCEIVDDKAVIRQDASCGDLPSVAGVYPLSSLPIHKSLIEAGLPFSIPDVYTTEMVDEELRQLCIQLKVISYLDVPVIKNGIPVGILCIVQSVPRYWTSQEAELAVEISERTWAAVERARAERALHESEAALRESEKLAVDRSRELEEAYRQNRNIVESIADCFYTLDKDLRFCYVNEAAEKIWGIPRAELIGRRIEEVFPDLINISLSHFRKALEEKSPQQYEVFSKVIQRWGDMNVYPTHDGISVYFRDTTERKKMEEITTFHSHTLASLQEAICAVDENFNITFWNGMAEEVFGWAAQEAIGSPSKEIFKMISPKREESIDNILKNNGYTGEAIYRNKDGKEVHTSVICSVMRDAQGNYIGNVSSFRDITKHKRAEEALRESEEKYRLLFESMTEMFQILEPIFDDEGKAVDFRYIMINKATENMGGKKREEMVGKTAKELWGIVEDYWLEMLSTVLRTGEPVQMENYSQEMDVYYDLRAWKASEHNVAIVFSNITDKKRAGEILRKSVERFHALVAASSDVVFSMSPDWREICYLQGKNNISDTDNPSSTWLDDYIHPDDQPKVMEIINEAIRTKSTFELEHRALRSDGTLGWTFSRAIPQLDGNGEILEWIGTASDITARKQVEEALQKSNDVLKKSIEMKDEFLSLISHEFRTPLTVIISAIQMLKTFSWNELSDKAKGYFDTIRHNSNRQLKLVNNILDLTKINAGRFEVHSINSDIVQLTKRIIESIQPYAERKKIRLSFSFAPTEIIIGIDPEKYERILLNLLSNAIKYTPKEGSVTVKLKRKIVNKKDMACIQISDNGIGIPSDKHQHIFERFGQVDSLLSRQSEGTGIGLHLTRMFVEMLGGEIKLDSKLGIGSTFTVTLPVSKVKETLSEKMASEMADNRTTQLTEIEFSDVYFDKQS